jgi:hypothetical protein
MRRLDQGELKRLVELLFSRVTGGTVNTVDLLDNRLREVEL